MALASALSIEDLSDLELAQLIIRGDEGAMRLVTQRNNRRLFRAAWSILKDRSEAEDAVQDAYLKAFRSIGGFVGASSLSTWLTRIVINEALARRRAAERRARSLNQRSVLVLDEYREKLMAGSSLERSPEGAMIRAEIAKMLEAAIARLPELFRTVLVLRDIEGLSVEETAEAMEIAPATVKTRLLRARRRLQQMLSPELGAALAETADFAGADCEAMTARVLTAFAKLRREQCLAAASPASEAAS